MTTHPLDFIFASMESVDSTIHENFSIKVPGPIAGGSPTMMRLIIRHDRSGGCCQVHGLVIMKNVVFAPRFTVQY